MIVGDENGLQLGAGSEAGRDGGQLIQGETDLPQVGELPHLGWQAGQPVVAQLQELHNKSVYMAQCSRSGGSFTVGPTGSGSVIIPTDTDPGPFMYTSKRLRKKFDFYIWWWLVNNFSSLKTELYMNLR